ncbi:Transposase family tnp2-domain-containing protein, partial [Hygrophoropsis aurantiaca]
LSEIDRDNIRAFKFWTMSNISRLAFNQMRFMLRGKLSIDSEYVILHRLAILSGVKPVSYDCCIKSCIAYTSKYQHHQYCPFCDEPRLNRNGGTRRRFYYLPIIPRLQGFFQSPTMIENLSYRADYEPSPDKIRDIFDSNHYHRLLRHRVVVDDEKLSHRYFSDKRDIALSLCTDSYLLYKRRRGGPSATPLLLQNYNLPPQIRTHLSNLLCVGIIPGPNQPKDLESFLAPLDDECADLAHGVETFDAQKRALFALHAYIIFKLGDIIAIEKYLGIKGHNAIFPCRSCKIKGVRGNGNTYYVPLQPPINCDLPEVTWDANNLPLRKHIEFAEVVSMIEAEQTAAQKDRIAKAHGIKRSAAMHRVGSIDCARSLPWEWFHLLLENVVPNLVKLWTGKYKGLDVGSEDYQIAPHVWEEIGAETATAVQHIPAPFVRVLGNIALDQSLFTAESWCFWFIYLAPILLEGRFPKNKYYKHMCELGNIMKATLKFSITLIELDELEERVIKWVRTYEKYYYQYRTDRLSTCTLTIHGLLHWIQGIRDCGPVWTTWTFYMERFCAVLQSGLHSRRHPWGNLNKRLLHMTYIEQLTVRYDLTRELSTKIIPLSVWAFCSCFGAPFADPGFVLRPPYQKTHGMDVNLRRQLSVYYGQVLGKHRKEVSPRLSQVSLSCAGKVRIQHGGDSIRTRLASRNLEPSDSRKACYIRYEIVFEAINGQEIQDIKYGDLENIFIFHLPADPFFNNLSGQLQILALITPWDTEKTDAAKKTTYRKSKYAPIVTDLRNIKAVVGLVETRGRWGVIDRGLGMAATVFVEDADLDEDNANQ